VINEMKMKKENAVQCYVQAFNALVLKILIWWYVSNEIVRKLLMLWYVSNEMDLLILHEISLNVF